MTTKVTDPVLDNPMPGSAKGEIIIHNGTDHVALGAPAVDQVLTGDPSAPEGAKWALPTDSLPVGMMAPYGGSSAPSKWLMADGSEVSQTTYADLYAVLGSTFNRGDEGAGNFRLPDMRGRTAIGASTTQGRQIFNISAMDEATEQLTVPSNETLHTGLAVVYTASGTAIGGLVSGNTYYVIVVDSTHVKLATSRSNAVSGNAIDLTGTLPSGTHQLTYYLTARSAGDLLGTEGHTLTKPEMPSHTHSYTRPNTTGGTFGGDPGGNASGTTGAAGSSEEHYNMPPALGINWIIYAGA